MSVYGNMKLATLTGYKAGATNELNEVGSILHKTVTNYSVAIYTKSKTYVTENGVKYDLAVVTGIATTSPQLAECNDVYIELEGKKYKVKNVMAYSGRYFMLDLEEVK